MVNSNNIRALNMVLLTLLTVFKVIKRDRYLMSKVIEGMNFFLKIDRSDVCLSYQIPLYPTYQRQNGGYQVKNLTK